MPGDTFARLTRRLGSGARRARDSRGQGLIELLISLTILALVVGSLLTVLTAGAISLQRSDQKGTALAIADKQMELYRALDYNDIELSHTAIPATGTYVTAHSSDSSIPAATACGSNYQPANCLVVDNTNCPASGCIACPSTPGPSTAACAPVQTISGATSPDHRTYEIDTYVTVYTPNYGLSSQGATNGAKQVLVVVRDPALSGAPILAREASDFQPLTTATS